MSLRKFNNYDLDGYKPVLAWNPLAMRCTPVTEGCRHCWHLAMADRLAMNTSLKGPVRAAYLGGAPEALEGFNVDPPKGRVIAVQFMGDLWHKEIPQSYRDCIFDRIRRCPESVFLLLTKRPERVTEDIPYSNCWLGTSAHDNASLFAARDAMAKHCYRSKRWLSIEPALSPVEPIGFGLYDFIACGPEMVSGHETGDSSWIDAMTDWPKHYPGTSFYDKRRDWKIRQWPEAWKAIGKAKGGVS